MSGSSFLAGKTSPFPQTKCRQGDLAKNRDKWCIGWSVKLSAGVLGEDDIPITYARLSE